ncbi:hypothetical protein pneo_cds_48 [Pandoravirus neocaledonia]|uniref:Uncharacterized protein n=1 Tax=Pandoravirus neocaledonia TaxID=2107708 RepID=A0A2U7UBB3_9VIRU|nr:hypothetical protein pneo_cds_48 [Pandoravirus neocaledonia]AVK75655.1 hypothetical protein pneo_cds_48 [Pandoravirus neocaledonia]
MVGRSLFFFGGSDGADLPVGRTVGQKRGRVCHVKDRSLWSDVESPLSLYLASLRREQHATGHKAAAIVSDDEHAKKYKNVPCGVAKVERVARAVMGPPTVGPIARHQGEGRSAFLKK